MNVMTGAKRDKGTRTAGMDPGSPCISFLAPQDVRPLARLYTEVFLADEPTSVRIAPDPARLLPHAEWYIGSLVPRGFSLAARDPGSGEPVGFLFSFDVTDEFSESPGRYAAYLENFHEAVLMIDALEQRFLERGGIPPGSVLHTLQAGVRANFRQRGVLAAMMEQLVSRARERGYRQIVAECTNPVSHTAFLNLGFRPAGFLPYDTFLIHGRPYFAGLEGGLFLVVRDL